MEIYSKDPESEVFILLDEIMSLRRERRELLSSLTPGLSVWKSLGQPEVVLAANNCTPAPVQEMERGSAHEQLGCYTDSILQDMDDLVNRMLSMAYVLVKPDGAALSTYMADELVNSTSSLKDACMELYIDSKDAHDDMEDEVPEYGLSDLCYRFLRRPLDFENKLTLLITKEEEEDYRKEVEKEEKRLWEVRKENTAKYKRWEKKQKEMEKKRRGEYEKKMQEVMEELAKEFPFFDQHEEEEEEEEEDDDEDADEEKEVKKENLELDPSTMEYLKKGMESCEISFTDRRDSWNTTWGSKSVRCGSFQDKTTLTSMHFTHTIQSSCRVTGSTLEIYSFEILELKEGLEWPLKLYGMVAARDTVDHNRNIVFSRSNLDYQELTEDEGCLCLTGPSRAIVALDNVDFEVALKIKGGEKSQGKELMTLSKRFDCTYDGTGTSLMFENSLCKAVLKLNQLLRAVQATIVGVCVVEGDWPFEYGCRVACSALDAGCSSDATADEVVLLDCRGGPGGGSLNKEVCVGSDGYLHLSRNVVSVQSDGTLRVVICSYPRPDVVSRSDLVDREWNISIPAQECQIIEKELSVGDIKVKVVVAWSLLVKEKLDLLVDCPRVEA